MGAQDEPAESLQENPSAERKNRLPEEGAARRLLRLRGNERTVTLPEVREERSAPFVRPYKAVEEAAPGQGLERNDLARGEGVALREREPVLGEKVIEADGPPAAEELHRDEQEEGHGPGPLAGRDHEEVHVAVARVPVGRRPRQRHHSDERGAAHEVDGESLAREELAGAVGGPVTGFDRAPPSFQEVVGRLCFDALADQRMVAKESRHL